MAVNRKLDSYLWSRCKQVTFEPQILCSAVDFELGGTVAPLWGTSGGLTLGEAEIRVL